MYPLYCVMYRPIAHSPTVSCVDLWLSYSDTDTTCYSLYATVLPCGFTTCEPEAFTNYQFLAIQSWGCHWLQSPAYGPVEEKLNMANWPKHVRQSLIKHLTQTIDEQSNMYHLILLKLWIPFSAFPFLTVWISIHSSIMHNYYDDIKDAIQYVIAL